MKVYLLFVPIAMLTLSGCGMVRAMDCNKCAIQRSSAAIERNTEALEKVTQNLKEMQNAS